MRGRAGGLPPSLATACDSACLIAAVALPLALWPPPARAGPRRCPIKIEEKQGAIDGKQREGARPDGRHPAATRRASTRCRPTSPTLQAQEDAHPGRPRRQARAAVAASRTTCAPSAPASPGCGPSSPRAATRSPQRLVELYKADSPDILTVVLNSDGFAELLENSRVRPPHRPPGQPHHHRGHATPRPSPTDRRRHARRPRGRGDRDRRRRRSSAATRSPRVKGELVEPPRRRTPSARAEKNTVARRPSRATASSSRATSQACRREEAEIQARWPASRPAAIGPVRQGSGGLDLAGQRPDRLAVRPALGPPARGRRHRHPVRHAGARVRRRAPSRIAGWVSGYGNYVCIQHAGGAVDVLRPQHEPRRRASASPSPRARSSPAPAARATASARTSTSRRASTARRWTPWATCSQRSSGA